MIRKKTVTAKGENADVAITIFVNSGKTLTKDEGETMLSSLADKAMLAIKDTPYLRVALHEIRTK